MCVFLSVRYPCTVVAPQRWRPCPSSGNGSNCAQRSPGLLRMSCRSTSLIRKRLPLGPLRKPMLKVLRSSRRQGRFLMSEVPLYGRKSEPTRHLRDRPQVTLALLSISGVTRVVTPTTLLLFSPEAGPSRYGPHTHRPTGVPRL